MPKYAAAKPREFGGRFKSLLAHKASRPPVQFVQKLARICSISIDFCCPGLGNQTRYCICIHTSHAYDIYRALR